MVERKMPKKSSASKRVGSGLSGTKASKEPSKDVAKEPPVKPVSWDNIPQDFKDIKFKCLNPKEELNAINSINRYLEEFSITDISDKGILKTIIYDEILLDRQHDLINAQSKVQKGFLSSTVVANIKSVMELCFKLNTEIMMLKDSLGLVKGKDKKTDDGSRYDLLLKKLKLGLYENQASRYFQCGACGTSQMLRVTPNKWESIAHPHPFFKDKILGNEALIKFYILGHDTSCPNCNHNFKSRLSNKDVGEILETSPDYIEWLITKWDLNRELIEAKYSKNVDASNINNSKNGE